MYEYLDRIISPDDLKNLHIKELKILSGEIRDFMIYNVAKTGGHLASNLGVVEMTLALHSVFESPIDKIIWDVGHQSYVHKIICGRKDQFHTIRTFGGLSGFPKRNESCHDIFETGHSSTSISAALGIARARDLNKENYSVIAVIGDGAISGGMAFEALNDAGHAGNKIIVVLNDNEMSISQNVGAMSSYLSKIRTNLQYTKAKKEIEHLLNQIPSIGKGLTHIIEKIKNSLKYLLVPGIFFEEIGFTYLGPIDGHNIPQLLSVFRQAKKLTDPVFIHIVTKKGKGYCYAEQDPAKYHGIAPFYVETGELIQQRNLSYSYIFGEQLSKMAEQDKRIVAITAAMPEGTGLLGFKAKFPDRFFDVGIAEQHGVTMAAGLASAGMRPFFAVYSTFLQRAYDQILHDVCLQNLPVVLAIDRSGIVGEDGETHQGIFDISYLKHMPNITIMSPKDINELKKMLAFSISISGPVAIRYPKGTAVIPYCDTLEIQYGKWEILRESIDGVIFAVGRMVEIALQTADILLDNEWRIGVVNCRFIKPMDGEMIEYFMKQKIPIFSMEENVLSGGFGSGVLEYMNTYKEKYRTSSLYTFGIPDTFIPHGSVRELLHKFRLTPEKLAEQIRQIMGDRNDVH